jgi:hypothetical protein
VTIRKSVNHSFALIITGMLWLVACAHRVPSGEVIPPAANIVEIGIVLPTTSGFVLTDRRKIDALASFLQRECHWTHVDATRSKGTAVEGRGYRIVMRQVDGSQRTLDVEERQLLVGAFRSELSKRAMQRLDELCGVESVTLGTFR